MKHYILYIMIDLLQRLYLDVPFIPYFLAFQKQFWYFSECIWKQTLYSDEGLLFFIDILPLISQ